MADTAKLIVGEKTIELPIHTGTEGNRVVDITRLYNDTGLITLDSGFANTGGCVSKITYIDGEKGILRYRGYPIEELAERCDFLEVAYLLIYGDLPNADQLEEFRANIRVHTLLHEGMRDIFRGFPPDAHPMAILSSVTGALAIYCKDSLDPLDEEQRELAIYRLMAKMPTIAAFSYKQSIGQPFVYPQNHLTYCQNFLQMLFAVPSERYRADPDFVDALNLLLILHADHGQNCSTSAVRMVGSSNVNLFSAVSAGICALWGALHGGANEACINMLEQILADGRNLGKYIDKAKDPNDPFRLMGFGHRVYKNYDPRARIIKTMADRLLAKHAGENPLFELAQELEEIALKDPYFVERKLYPNVDFYSGIIYRAMGIPKNMFTVLFALGRLPGWIAHWREMHLTPGKRIHRPRQLYTGPSARPFVPLIKRMGTEKPTASRSERGEITIGTPEH
ncbi:MAG: citrate synthase [Planctomycetota bacterium]|nr:MAG: citrate synthase [Planctomycetota bacterium]